MMDFSRVNTEGLMKSPKVGLGGGPVGVPEEGVELAEELVDDLDLCLILWTGVNPSVSTHMILAVLGTSTVAAEED